MFRRADSVEESYDALVALLTTKDKLSCIANVSRTFNREIKEITKSITDIIQSLEQDNKPSLHLVVPSYYLMMKRLQTTFVHSSNITVFYNNLRRYMDEKFWPSIKAMHWMACYLDPSFKNFAFIPELTQKDNTFKRNLLLDLHNWLLAEMIPIASKNIAQQQDNSNTADKQNNSESDAPPSKRMRKSDDPYDEIRSLSFDSIPLRSSTSRNSIWLSATALAQSQCQSELSSYKLLQSFKTSRNPLDFWKQHVSDYPVMSQTARRLLCIPASSAQSERDFSSIGHSITDVRSQLSPETVEAIELVRWGMRLGSSVLND